uniref:Uncharacterized protein n=1 Tax=Chenopodium quinoa TaxID=63459 RepID=A0A803KR01_CHEQI
MMIMSFVLCLGVWILLLPLPLSIRRLGIDFIDQDLLFMFLVMLQKEIIWKFLDRLMRYLFNQLKMPDFMMKYVFMGILSVVQGIALIQSSLIRYPINSLTTFVV